MTPDQTPPVDTAALAAAETKVLPRVPEGYRQLNVGEITQEGDVFWDYIRKGPDGKMVEPLCKTTMRGLTLEERDIPYFRPIEPVPHTEGRNKSNHIPCTYCRGLGFIPSSMDIRQPTCPHCCGTKDEPEPHRAPFAPQVSDGFEREIKSIAGVSLG